MDGRAEEKTIVDPEELLRGALEKIVFFECRVGQLEAELAAAVQVAERARADASAARRRELELGRALEDAKGARGESDTRASELAERVRLLESERERLLSGLVDRARVEGAPGAGEPEGDGEGQADLAGFIAELRAEIERLRDEKGSAGPAWGAAEGAYAPAPLRRAAPEPVARIAERLREAGRVGFTSRDSERMKDLLPTRSDRVLYERSMERLGSSDPEERLRAVRALEALGSKASAPLLAAALGREPDAGVKVALLGALARFEEPFAAGLAERELRDPRPPVRIAALEALAAVSDARPRLSGALGDESPLVRRRAALLLGFAPGPEAEEALAGALSDLDGGVARAAAAALSGRPSARAQAALARALEHADVTVRRAAAGALGRWSGERVDADAPAHARRNAARRIAERLAAMGGGELRDAVLSAAPAAVPEDAPAPPVAVRAAAAPSPRPSPPLRGGEGEEFRPSPLRGGEGEMTAPAAAAIAAHRTAVAVLEEPGLAAPGPGLEAGLTAEVRAALRGCTTDDLAAATGEPRARVEAALQSLAAQGVLALRGTRWFTS